MKKVEACYRNCVFWDFSNLSWSLEGCYVSLDLSEDDKTVCYCEHLTNFALLFDFTGVADVGDNYAWLDIVTYAILSVSIVLLIITQLVTHIYQRYIDI